ncbi:MAG: CvpA family protein [Alphaproteobacteria bacterium]
MLLTILDVIFIVVVLMSAILAMVRGFVREVLSIASWIIAALAAYLLHETFLPMIRPYFESQTVAVIVSAAGVFFVALVLTSYVTMRISDFVIDSRVGALDRALGFLFGAARGTLLVVIALLFFNWLVPKAPGWVDNARSRPLLEDLGEQLIAALPEDVEASIVQRFRGGDEGSTPPAQNNPGETPNYEGDERQGLDQLIQSSDQ